MNTHDIELRSAVIGVITDVWDRAKQIDDAADDVLDLIEAALQSQPEPLLPNAPGWPKWYVVSKQGHATLCKSEADALDVVRLRNDAFPKDAPHTAMPLMPALQSQDREDAERYRWIRSKENECNVEIPTKDAEGYLLPGYGDDLDSAIDHARRTEGEA